eukprot:scaffold269322_cov49-Tisochrysis_lutea.AAC.1
MERAHEEKKKRTGLLVCSRSRADLQLENSERRDTCFCRRRARAPHGSSRLAAPLMGWAHACGAGANH